MYYVYIIQSVTNNSYYIGYTHNPNERIDQHNKGRSRYTKNKGPWILKYLEKLNTLKEARHREKQIKSWKKRKAIERLINSARFV